jgi:hypothetical protein
VPYQSEARKIVEAALRDAIAFRGDPGNWLDLPLHKVLPVKFRLFFAGGRVSAARNPNLAAALRNRCAWWTISISSRSMTTTTLRGGTNQSRIPISSSP